jgi:outer membrane protein
MLKILISLLFIFSSISIVHADDTSSSLTLQECYQLTLKQSETIAKQQEIIREAQARFSQSLSQILPRASYLYTNRLQDGSGSSNFTLSEIPEGKFVFSQPLFSGFKEFATIAASRAERKQRAHEEQRARELLFVDVYDAFYFLLSYEEDIDTLKNIQDVLLKRIEELHSREDLGRTRPSEVLTAEVRLSRIEVELESIQNNRDQAKQLLEFLTGKTIPDIEDNSTVSADEITSLEQYIPLSRNRSDVLAAQEAFKASQNLVTAAKGDFFPNVDLEGNYYTKRIGNSSGVDWDMTVSVEVPIFEGGENINLLKESKSKENQAELNFQETQRKAELEIKNAYTQLQSSLKRKTILEKALSDSQKNYELHLEDYRVNSVSNLDVLQALEDLQDIQRDFTTAKNETLKAYWKLKVATGDLPHDSF